jgi:hypothetical protein
MRYVIQLLVPALIFVGVVYLLTRQRRRDASSMSEQPQQNGSDTAAFIVILALGAVVAIATAFVLQSLLE